MAEKRFVVCIDNTDYPAALELRKVYELVPDAEAEKHRQIRVVDESGDDYLYSADRFVSIELSKDAEDAITKAA